MAGVLVVQFRCAGSSALDSRGRLHMYFVPGNLDLKSNGFGEEVLGDRFVPFACQGIHCAKDKFESFHLLTSQRRTVAARFGLIRNSPTRVSAE